MRRFKAASRGTRCQWDLAIWLICTRLSPANNERAGAPTEEERELLQRALFLWMSAAENHFLSQMALQFLVMAFAIPETATLHEGGPAATRFVAGLVQAVSKTSALVPNELTAVEVQLCLILSSARQPTSCRCVPLPPPPCASWPSLPSPLTRLLVSNAQVPPHELWCAPSLGLSSH